MGKIVIVIFPNNNLIFVSTSPENTFEEILGMRMIKRMENK